jgi:hypothetical protein
MMHLVGNRDSVPLEGTVAQIAAAVTKNNNPLVTIEDKIGEDYIHKVPSTLVKTPQDLGKFFDSSVLPTTDDDPSSLHGCPVIF